MNMLDEQQLHVHVPIVGLLFIVGHALFLVAALFVFSILTGIALYVRDAEASGILIVVGWSIALFLGVLALPGLVAGFGLLARKGWARILGVVVAILGLVNIPIGTLIGIYAIWVLLQDRAGSYFDGALNVTPDVNLANKEQT